MACIRREQQIPSLEVEVLAAQSCLTLCDPMDCTCQAPLSVGFSRGIFLTKELNLGFLQCGLILYHLNHQESPAALGK